MESDFFFKFQTLTKNENGGIRTAEVAKSGVATSATYICNLVK